MLIHLLLPEIHAQYRNFLQVTIGKSWTSDREEFWLSLESFFLAALFYLLAEFVGSIEEQQDMPKPISLSKTKMEASVFSMGLVPKETKQQKKERLRKEAKRKKPKVRLSRPLPKKSIWCILPKHRLEGLEFWIHTLRGHSFIEKRRTLLESIEKMKKPAPSVPGFDPTFGEAHRKEYLVKAQKVMSYLHENQRIRWIFKRFFTQQRIALFEKVNETDPITMEPFRQPVLLHEFGQRKIYQFEAESLARHIHKQLVKNDGQIPTPNAPRNPLTNQLFRAAQLMGLLKQCKELGHSSWVLEAFIAARYDLTSFVAIYSKPLRLYALKTSMADESGWDFIDTLSDFIRSQHTIHGKLFPKNTYDWAISHALREDRMEKWKKLCLKWYETDIMVEDPDTKEMFLGVVEAKTKPLCEPPNELVALKQRRKTMRLAEVNGSRSAGHTEGTG